MTAAATRQNSIHQLMAALLLLATIALYWPATGNDFVNYDDPDYVTANPHVQGGLTREGMKWAFVTPVSCNWHPLTVVSHMLDCQVFGLKAWGHHLTSVLLHAIDAVLVFALLLQMTGATWRSLFVAALFAVHPLRVQSVAWVAERKDVLSAFFGLLALIFYACYAEVQSQNAVRKLQKPDGYCRETAGRGWWVLGRLPSSTLYLLSLCCFALGLMSKAMLVTWPFVMLLLDCWPLERFKRGSAWRIVTEKIPFFVLAAVASVVTISVQQRAGSVTAIEDLPLGARMANALISYCRYLEKLFWPADLAVFYPRHGEWPLEQVLSAGGLILGISVVFFVLRRRYPFLVVGWLWFLGTLVPVIGLIQVGGHSMADRYTYIPLIGVLVLVVWGACILTKGSHYPVIAFSVAGLTAIIVCMALTRQQIGYWKDSETLFRRALAVTENNYVAHNNLGSALIKSGKVDESIGQFQEAIRLQPGYPEAHNNLGAALDRKGRLEEAIGEYQNATALKAEYFEAHYNLGNALFHQGQTDRAVSQYQEAIRLQPENADSHFNLGAALDKKGQIDEAIRQYGEAIRLKPDNAEAHYNLGTALGKTGQTDEAIRRFREAARLRPDNADAHYNLGTALGKKGQTDEAIHQFREAVRLQPDNADAYHNLGIALSKQGQMDLAIRQYEEAIRLKPDYAIAHNHLGGALAEKGQMDLAIRQFREAIRLKPDCAEAQHNLDRALKLKNAAAGP